jgi:hypothetical protein
MQHNEQQRIQTNGDAHTAEALFLDVGAQMQVVQGHPFTTRRRRGNTPHCIRDI